MLVEITLTDLALLTGLSVSHLQQLIRRGILPEGRKGTGADYRYRYMPKAECLRIIREHSAKNKHWKTARLNWDRVR